MSAAKTAFFLSGRLNEFILAFDNFLFISSTFIVDFSVFVSSAHQ